MRGVRPALRLLPLWSAALVATGSLVSAAHAQAQPVAPVVSSMSPRVVGQDATVTLIGSNMVVPGYRTELVYKHKYGTGQHYLVLRGNSKLVTFVAPLGARPDGMFIQLVDTTASIGGGQTRASVNNPLASNVAPLPGNLWVPGPALLGPVILKVEQTDGSGGYLRPGTAVLYGRYLLQPPGANPLSLPGMTAIESADGVAPRVSFAGIPLTASAVRYNPSIEDQVTVTVPTLPHNTVGYLRSAGTYGQDSVRLVAVLPPRIDRVTGNMNGVDYTVTKGFVEGGRYQIHGENLRAQRLPLFGSREVLYVGFGAPGSLEVSRLSAEGDTLLSFTMPSLPSGPAARLVVTHPGGTAIAGPFSYQPLPNVTAVVAEASDVIAGTNAVLRVSLSSNSFDYSIAGKLVVTVSSPLDAALPTPIPMAFTGNPARLELPTNIVTSTFSGTVVVRHESSQVSSATTITVRPPRPTALTTASDTLPTPVRARASVSFDRPGPATVLLSSSDPSVLSVPPSATRAPGAATVEFDITPGAVSTYRTVTVTASLNGVAVSKTVVVGPGGT